MTQSLGRLSLNFKLNAVLLVAFVLLLIALVAVTNTGFNSLVKEVSQEEIALEVDTLQQHFANIEEGVLNAARLLASAPGLSAAVAAGDTSAVRTTIQLQSAALRLDDFDVVDSEGVRLLTVANTSITLHAESEDRLLTLGLLGITTTGLVAEEDWVLLSGVVPVKSAAGEVIGAVIASRDIDEVFMEELNFARTNPYVAFVHEDAIAAQSIASGEEFRNIDDDQVYIDQALRGQVSISEGVFDDEDGSPESFAYIPLRIGGAFQAVLALKDDVGTLLAFQRDITIRNFIAVTVLSLIILFVTVLFIRQSVTLPLTQLKTTSQQIAGGSLSSRARIGSQDEIGQLAVSFNGMADNVTVLMSNLERRMSETQTARERAERSEQVKSAFLSSMSHELRTPLNAVINFTQFVVDGDVGEVNGQQVELLTDVVGNAKHLLNLINDVLDMSKIESGSLNLFIEDNINLNTLLNSVISTGRSLLADKPVTLHKQTGDDLPLIRADRQRVVQILHNIMSNACKFTEDGTIKVTAICTEDEVVIAITDTGPGIDADDQAAVFEPFKQTETGLRKGGGTGLGMPISRRLAEAHGGRLWLESKAGQGAVFSVALPIKSETLVPLLMT